MFTSLRKLVQDESGATAIEYGLIAALVAVAIIFALSQLGDSLTGIFERVSTQLDTAADGGGGGGGGGAP
jgi:pilus assembly protein Flp/PilA